MKEQSTDMLAFKGAFDLMAGMLRKKCYTRIELRKAWDLLKDFNFEQIQTAIDTWLLKDNNFMPSPGELAAIIKANVDKDQSTGELKSLEELRNIKSKFGTIETETYSSSRCARCNGTGYVVLNQKKYPHYGAAFACSCYKGVPKSERMNVYTEGLTHGYDWPDNINSKKGEKL